MNPATPPDERWKLVAGCPSLAFTNTVAAWVGTRSTREDLLDYDALLRWSVFASVLGGGARDRLREEARRSPSAAVGVHRRALRLRESIFRVGLALMKGGSASAGDLVVLDREAREARRHQNLSPRSGRVHWAWTDHVQRLDRVLWPLALDAATVFGGDDVERLKQCPECGWLFLDATRNHSRQWCDMADCGNLAKVRRFRRRQRQRRRAATRSAAAGAATSRVRG